MTTSLSAVDRLIAIDLTLLTPFTKVKERHEIRCNRCGNEWSTTPMAIFQSYKKNPAMNGCSVCAHTARYGDKRQAVLDEFATRKPHLVFLSEYDGRQFFNGINNKVKFRNTNCGHEFETYPNYILSDRSKFDCIICGSDARSIATTERNKQK